VAAGYRPSEPTGWPGLSATVGGHTTAMEFVVDGRPWRVSLLGTAVVSDPRYLDRPGDEFAALLEKEEHYTFEYRDGFHGVLTVRSYSVFLEPGGFGADLHLVYEPEPRRGDPPADDAMQWIQAVFPDNELDRGGRANPFYPYGGCTSVDGCLVVNVQGCLAGSPGTRRAEAETFLVRDTGRCDTAGRGVVEVFGGVRWGWEAGPTG
jgi:hypothetical protein